MLESIWPDLAIDAGKGLLAGSASLAMQWLAPKLLAVIGRIRARRAAKRQSLALDLAQRANEGNADFVRLIPHASALRRALRALCNRVGK